MPPKKKPEEAVIFLVNVGQESNEILENETQTFLDKAKIIVKQILERKIFLRKKDNANIICFGSNETDNEENMENIYQFKSELEHPNWEMVEKTLQLQSTNRTSSWVEGLHVALQFAKEKCSLAEDDVKVIIINNFKESEDVILQFNARDVADEIVNSKVKLMFIGSSDFFETSTNNLNISQQLAAKVYRFIKQTENNDFYAYDQIDNYLLETRFYKNPPVKPTPWKCPLEIGSISISTLTYVKVTEPAPFPSWKLTTRSDSVGFPPESEVDVKRTTEYVDRYRNVTDDENTNKGYKYGGTFIPFTDNDKDKAKFKGTVKSLIVRGFVKEEEVSLEHWFGKGSHIIVPEDNADSKNKFYALVGNMKHLGLVAIVRKVYQANSQPKMGILFPRIEEGEIACLVHVGLPFIEERRVLKPREELNLLNEEQEKDIDDYIESMTLPKDDENFQPGSFCNPLKQHKWDYLSYRALNRDPLPPMDQYLMDLISTPKNLIEKSEPILEKLSQWVKPKPVVIKKKETSDENEENVNKVVNDDIKTEEELIKAAEEAEKEIKKKEDIFNEIVESTTNNDDDLFDDL
ncbi:X-ray repair cross-complementing protein 5-like [Leptopilina boulardi]|uniref:X-ray repair cross-complementing protein 5-like n=1 Tax=Leptopilina boulardi TaxID=63433 RepID=UPI0021F675E5|nr:X-ray repair cross-complementing protein 5-like [Leptopilina boulardi]